MIDMILRILKRYEYDVKKSSTFLNELRSALDDLINSSKINMSNYNIDVLEGNEVL